jgi:hypothetical protein
MFYQNQNDLNRLDFLIKYSCKLNSLSQRFSTWGTRTPGGTQDSQDYQKVENRWSKQIWISISKVNKGKVILKNFFNVVFVQINTHETVTNSFQKLFGSTLKKHK